MATSLNFDSLSVDGRGRVSFSGLGTGIDAQAAVDGIIQAKRLPIDQIERRMSERDLKMAAFQDLRSASLALREAVAGLRGAISFDGSGDIFAAKQVFASTSRDDAQTPSQAAQLMGVSVTSAAQADRHTVEVLQIAAAHKIASDSVAGAQSDALGLSGTFDINGASIDVDAADSLLDLKDAINAANSGATATGVTASLVSISDSEQVLVLTADATGTDAEMTVADTSGNVLQTLGVINGSGAIKNELQAAQNAELQVDGLATTIERQSNTITDIFTGVTLDLFKAETGTTIDLDVERDLNQVKSAVVDLVDAYNEVRTFINQQAVTDVPEDDETGAGILAGTSALSEVRARLAGAISAAVDGSDPTFAVLSQIGVTFQAPGEVGDPLQANTLKIDEAKLDAALVGDPEGVRALFAFGMTSSTSDVALAGFDGYTQYDVDGYTLNVAYAGGAVTSANIGGPADGSDDGSVQVDGNLLTVLSGGAKGLKMLYTGDAASSGIQLDVSVGIGTKMFYTLDSLVDETDGLIESEITALEDQNELAQSRVDRLEERLERETERLQERFAAMEAALASMNRVLESLREQIESVFNNDR